MSQHAVADRDLWPSVVELHFVPLTADCQGLRRAQRLLIQGKFYDIDMAFGPDRPPHCTAKHYVLPDKIVCSLWPNHDGPHVSTSVEYMNQCQFTIVSMASTT